MEAATGGEGCTTPGEPDVVCELGTLDPGESKTITVRLPADETGTVINFAGVESDGVDDGSNNSDSATTVVEESYQARILAADPEGFYRLGESSSEGGLNDSSPNNNDGLYGESSHR